MNEQNGDPLLRVMSLHALAYCERLFFLEEVEEIRVADERVYAGRTLHEKIAEEEFDETRSFELSSDALGLTGKLDAVRIREEGWIPYEHKRGRAYRDSDDIPTAWPSDSLQVSAYGMLLEEAIGKPVKEGRICYHAGGITVRVPLDEAARARVRASILKARLLRESEERPPISKNDRLCLHCSLASVCLPEEERLALDEEWEPVRLFPNRVDGKVLHVTSHGAKISRSGRMLKISTPDSPDCELPVQEVNGIVLHGNAQITTQAIRLCAVEGIALHWLTSGGQYIGALASGTGAVYRCIRQYHALSEPSLCLGLSKRLVHAKIEGQFRFLLRATRGRDRSANVQESCIRIRDILKQIERVESTDSLRGLEGMAGKAYFKALPDLIVEGVPEEMKLRGRSRRPPRDPFNAILSFGYVLLYRSVLEAILSVGLESALGFYHRPRSAAHPLALDLMELFRVPIWDMTLVGSINRKQWDLESDFLITREHVWLSELGKKKAICLYERRLDDTWKHPVTEYSLSYARTVELEVRLLEKEWSGQPGLFARARLR